MYVKYNENGIEKYPYTYEELRLDNPNVSFPLNLSQEDMDLFNIAMIYGTPKPTHPDSNIEFIEGLPVKNSDGNYIQTWIQKELTAEELQAKTETLASKAREKRNSLLKMSDWTMLLDSPLTEEKKEEWRIYREMLRLIPSHPDFPFTVVWPTAPEQVSMVQDITIGIE